jgi:hypothetical protein
VVFKELIFTYSGRPWFETGRPWFEKGGISIEVLYDIALRNYININTVTSFTG